MASKGRLSFRQFMPANQTNCGINMAVNVWIGADSVKVCFEFEFTMARSRDVHKRLV